MGTDRAASSLSLVAATGSLVALVANPLFGRLSDRTTSRWGMRRPWMMVGLAGGSFGILVVALAPEVWVVLIGWCLAQLFFNAMLAAMVAVLPDQVPVEQRGTVAGVLGVCLPIASVGGTYVVKVFTGNELAMFLAPCAIGGFFIVVFALYLDDRRLAPADKPPWSWGSSWAPTTSHRAGTPTSRGLSPAASCSSSPTRSWSPTRRTTSWITWASAEDEVPEQIFLGTLTQAVVVVVASVVGGRLSDRTGRRKPFVAGAAVVYGLALFMIAVAGDFDALPRRDGGRRPRLRPVHGRRPRARRGRVARPRQRGEGPRGAQHRRRVAILARPGVGAVGPGDRLGQLPGAVRGRRGLRALGAAAILPVEESPVTDGGAYLTSARTTSRRPTARRLRAPLRTARGQAVCLGIPRSEGRQGNPSLIVVSRQL